MSAYFTMNRAGLNYLISSPDPCPSRQCLFNLLTQAVDRPASIEQLTAWNERERKAVAQTIYTLLKQGWVDAVDKDSRPHGEPPSADFLQQLAGLSSSGEVVLADGHGLVIASCGFPRHRTHDLAASATRLLSVNEAARRRNMDLYDGQPWLIHMHWGRMQVEAQQISLGSMKFVLIVGGVAQLENHAFISLLGQLARRYACGQ